MRTFLGAWAVPQSCQVEIHQALPHHLLHPRRQMRRKSSKTDQRPDLAPCWAARQNAVLAEVAAAAGQAEAAALVDVLVQHSEDRCSSS